MASSGIGSTKQSKLSIWPMETVTQAAASMPSCPKVESLVKTHSTYDTIKGCLAFNCTKQTFGKTNYRYLGRKAIK